MANKTFNQVDDTATPATAVGMLMDLRGDGAIYVQWEMPAPWSYTAITTQTTTAIKTGAGVLHAIIINKATTGGVITIYDNTAGSGDKIGTITQPALTLLNSQQSLYYDAEFLTGLTIVTSGANQDITVLWR